MNENSKITNANSISRDQQLVQGCDQNFNIKNENEEILLNDNNSRNSSSEKIIEKSSSNGKIYKETDRQESIDSFCSEDSQSTSHSQCTAISCGSFTETRGFSEPPSENEKTESLQQRISPQRQESIFSVQSKVVPLKDLSREAIIRMPYGGLVIEKLFKGEECEHKYTTAMSNKDSELKHRHKNCENIYNYELSTAKRQQNLENFVQKSRSASPPPIPPKSYMNYFPSDSDDQQTTDSNDSDQHKNRLLAIIHKTNGSKEESLNHSQKIFPNVEGKHITTTDLPPQSQPQPPPPPVPSIPMRLSSLTEAKVEETTQQPTFASANHIGDIKRFSHPDFTKDYFQHLPDQDLFLGSAKKRFSNIETSSNSDHFCSQIKQTAPVRHSTFQSSTTESFKKIENDKVITDVTNCNKEFKTDKIFDKATTGTDQVHEVMSDINLKQKTADQIRPIGNCLDKQQNHRHVEQHHIIDENNSSIYRKTAEKQKVTSSKISSNDFTYDEFRQRAKELSTKNKTENELFDYDKVLKEFDQLSKLLKQELDSRPSMTASDKRKSTECYQSQSQDDSSCKRQEKMSEIMRNLTEMKSKVIENKNMQSSSYFGSHDNVKRFSTLPLQEKFNESKPSENQKRFSVNIPMTIPVRNIDSTQIFNQYTQKQESAPKKEYQIPITKENDENKEQPIQRESLFSNLHQKHEKESTKSFTSSSKIQLEKTVDSQKEYRIPIAIDPSFVKQKTREAEHPLRQRSISQPREYQIPVQVIQTPPTAYHPLTVPAKKSQSNLFRQASTGVEYFIPVEIDASPIPKHATFEIPMQISHHFATSKPKPPPVPPMFDFSEQTAHQENSSREHHIPMLIESTDPIKTNATRGMEIPQRLESQLKAMAAARDEFFSHFTSNCQPKPNQSIPSPPANAQYQNATQENIATKSYEDSCSTSLDDHSSSRSFQYYPSAEYLNDRYSYERQFSQPNYEELGASSENIAKPFRREVEICMRGKRPNIKAPRLTVSTNDLSTSPRSYENYNTHTQLRTPPRHHPFMFANRSAHPKLASLSEETSDHRIKHVSFSQPTEQFHSESPQIQQMQQLPLGDDIEFRQKMAQEWLSKVAEREERRQQKIIKISKVEENFGTYGSSSRKPLAIDIGDEFLQRVKERRSKLCMTSDSELESGPESMSKGSKSESDEPNVKVIEGQSVADLKRLPKHIRDFARLTSQIIKSHQEEAAAAEMLSSDASKIKMTTDSITDDAGRYPYKEKSNGYMSEPEKVYDSDYYSTMYSLDRRRTPAAPRTVSIGRDERDYGTIPNPVRSGIGSYKIQPGKIENYAPGYSSLSEKEKVTQRDIQKLSQHYTEGNLSRALKEQGYESDSNLIFRKKEESLYSEINPNEQRQSYKNLQSGGEPPLLGFRKPAPEKLKESEEAPPRPPLSQVIYDANGFDYQESPSRYIESDVNIHYKTPIRYEPKEIIAEEELARRQADSMRKLYEEERRQKYLKELQDINSRRHTDNFTPSQKSPIALNRYDDFVCDLAPKSPNISKTIARALFNFQGQTARELSFKKGDMILIRRQIDDNWYEGEYNAMLGLFPVSYVEIISRDHIKRLPKRPSEGQARAKFNFQAQSGIELSLNKGELVTLTRRVDKNWFEGKIANRKGIFPVSYVEVLTDIGAEDLASTTTTTTIHTKAIVPTKQPSLETLRTNINNELNSLTKRNPSGILRETKTIQKTKVLHVDTNTEPLSYRALYKYRPQNNDELELLEGDLIYVIEKCDDGWYVGSSQRTGCFGTFPGNYVELI